MSINFPKQTYFTFDELRERWQCSERDLHRVIISIGLRPAMRVQAGGLSLVEWDDDPFDGLIATKGMEDDTLVPPSSCWVYLQNPEQIEAFDCRFVLATNVRLVLWPTDSEDASWTRWYWLPQPIKMKDIEDSAVFMFEDVAGFERRHGETEVVNENSTELGSRERATLLRIIAVMLELLQSPKVGRTSEAAVIQEMIDNYGDKPGIKQRTLQQKFADAKKTLTST